MLRHLPVFFALMLASSAMAQVRSTSTSRFGSTSGFGSVLYPGTGHAPNVRITGNITDPGFALRFGSSVRGYPAYRGVMGGAQHPGHARQVVVPVPVFVGGGYYDYNVPFQGYQPPIEMPQQQQLQTVVPPVVIINQNYRPDTANPVVREYSEPAMRRYDAPVHPMPDPNDAAEPPRQARRARVEDDKPTIYLIAFKDHSILPALAYWVEGDILNYITRQGTPNRVSLTLIDRDFSKQLNSERQLEFSLP